jgi:Ser-tRNA(Ala) deacylase AlaX
VKKVYLVTILNGKNIETNGYEVILENTIIFPEGGGQEVMLFYSSNDLY